MTTNNPSHADKRGRSLVATFLIVFTLWTLQGGRVARAQDSQNGRLVVVEIGANTLRVPEKYFLGTRPKTRQASGIYVRALTPTMDPMREDNKNEFLYAKGFGRTVGISIGDAKARTSLPFRLEARRKLGAPYEQRADQYGMRVYIPVESATANKGTLRQELYVAEDQGTLSSFIRCIRDADVPSPTCSQEFLHWGFLIDVTFNKHRLSDWRAIQQEVKELVDRFSSRS